MRAIFRYFRISSFSICLVSSFIIHASSQGQRVLGIDTNGIPGSPVPSVSTNWFELPGVSNLLYQAVNLMGLGGGGGLNPTNLEAILGYVPFWRPATAGVEAGWNSSPARLTNSAADVGLLFGNDQTLEHVRGKIAANQQVVIWISGDSRYTANSALSGGMTFVQSLSNSLYGVGATNTLFIQGAVSGTTTLFGETNSGGGGVGMTNIANFNSGTNIDLLMYGWGFNDPYVLGYSAAQTEFAVTNFLTYLVTNGMGVKTTSYLLLIPLAGADSSIVEGAAWRGETWGEQLIPIYKRAARWLQGAWLNEYVRWPDPRGTNSIWNDKPFGSDPTVGVHWTNDIVQIFGGDVARLIVPPGLLQQPNALFGGLTVTNLNSATKVTASGTVKGGAAVVSSGTADGNDVGNYAVMSWDGSEALFDGFNWGTGAQPAYLRGSTSHLFRRGSEHSSLGAGLTIDSSANGIFDYNIVGTSWLPAAGAGTGIYQDGVANILLGYAPGTGSGVSTLAVQAGHIFSFGSTNNGSAWIATSSSAEIENFNSGQISHYLDLSLTPGASYTPTLIWTDTSTGPVLAPGKYFTGDGRNITNLPPAAFVNGIYAGSQTNIGQTYLNGGAYGTTFAPNSLLASNSISSSSATNTGAYYQAWVSTNGNYSATAGNGIISENAGTNTVCNLPYFPLSTAPGGLWQTWLNSGSGSLTLQCGVSNAIGSGAATNLTISPGQSYTFYIGPGSTNAQEISQPPTATTNVAAFASGAATFGQVVVTNFAALGPNTTIGANFTNAGQSYLSNSIITGGADNPRVHFWARAVGNSTTIQVNGLETDAQAGAATSISAFSSGHRAYVSYVAASQLQTNSWLLLAAQDITWGNGYTNQTWIEFDVGFPTMSANLQSKFGLAHANASANTIMNGGTGQHGAWMMADTNSGDWQLYGCDGTALTNIDTGLSAKTGIARAALYLNEADNSGHGSVTAYVFQNGVSGGTPGPIGANGGWTAVATNYARLPIAGSYLNPFMGQQCTNNAASTEVDFYFIDGYVNAN